jgi:tetratricopeptide (TPR) repeat protein
VVRGLLFGLAGLAAWGTFGVLENLAVRDGLDLFVRRLDLDLSLHGTLLVDLLVAGPVLVLPAFLCGTAVAVHRSPQELGALLVGAAGGLVVAPQLLTFTVEGGELLASSDSATLSLYGAAIAAGGGLVVFLGTAGLSTPWRLVGALLALAGFGLARFPERAPIPVLSPWEQREPVVELLLDAPDGLLTVERDADGTAVATLDRRRLTPGVGEAVAEGRRIDLAWRLLGELEEGARPAVLVVGQLDPTRALRLVDLGAGRIDRTGSWHAAMPLLEERLFEGPPTWVPGEVLSPAAARARLAAGDYDLVLVPSVAGPAPTTRNLASPPGSTVVVWLDGANGVEDQHLGQEVLVSAAALRELHVGVARGPRLEALRLAGGAGQPGFLAAGEPLAPSPALERLQLRVAERRARTRERLAGRLAAAERPPGLATGLAEHFAAQRRSSPFDDPIEATEVSMEGARRFAEAAAAPEPDSLAIELVESLAFVLGHQRKVEEIEVLLATPAERHSPWPALEVALAQAALEFLEPERALEHLERAHGAFPGTVGSLAMEAEARAQTGDDAGSAGCLERAAALDPANHALERRLAIAWVRAGDPRGQEALQEALEEHPEDPELLRHRGPGPYPAAPAGFHPLGRSGHDH